MKRTLASVNQLLKDRDHGALKEIIGHMPPFEIAELMANKSLEDQTLIFGLLPPKIAAITFDYLALRIQKKVIRSLPAIQTANILRAMPADDRIDLLQKLPRPIVDEYIKILPDEERTLTLTLLGYPADSVGGLMTTDYIAVKKDWTAEKVLEHIRAYGHDSETIEAIYVVDDHDKLIDDIKLKNFLFVPKEMIVDEIGDHHFLALSAYDKAQTAIAIFRENDRVALPVIDANGIMLGIVTIDDILRIASEKSTATLQKVGGTEALNEPYMDAPFSLIIKRRAHWLVLLFIGEMFTATAMGFFEDEISKAVVLALFLPLIISSGGNSGSQSSTLIIRAMALGEVRLSDWWKIMRKEILYGLALGLILGTVGFARVALWSSVSSIYGAHWLLVAITIFLALIFVVLWGSLVGAMLPFILRRLGADPATSSAPLVATMVDVTGIVIYFCIAMVTLKGTLL